MRSTKYLFARSAVFPFNQVVIMTATIKVKTNRISIGAFKISLDDLRNLQPPRSPLVFFGKRHFIRKKNKDLKKQENQ